MHLEALKGAQENLELELETVLYRGDDTATVPTNIESAKFIQRQHIRSVVSKERYRIEETWLDTHPNLAALKGRVQVITWDGREARVVEQRTTQTGARIDNLPTADLRNLPHPTWMGWWIFNGEYFHSFSDLFEHDNPSPPRLTSDGATQWVIPYRRLQWSDIVVTAVRRNDAIVLQSVERRCFRSHEAFDRQDENQLITTSKVEYDGSLCSSMPLPSRGRHVNRSWPSNAEPFFGVTDIRVLSTTRIEPRDEHFVASIPRDAIVGDSRFNIAYHLGSTTLNVDGRLLETHQPLEGDVAENLAWWIANGHFLGPPDESGEPASNSTQPAASEGEP